jgi:tRNA G18 (ribose-2'-O)-methylase SpoU
MSLADITKLQAMARGTTEDRLTNVEDVLRVLFLVGSEAEGLGARWGAMSAATLVLEARLFVHGQNDVQTLLRRMAEVKWFWFTEEQLQMLRERFEFTLSP